MSSYSFLSGLLFTSYLLDHTYLRFIAVGY